MTTDRLHGDHDDFGGLQRDLVATRVAMDRRGLLRFAARFGVGAGALQLLGCGSRSPTSPSTSGSGTSSAGGTGSGSATCTARIPEETQGPFPGDGSNGPNVLGSTGVVRSDIRSSFAGLNGTADGVPLSIVLTIVSASTCAPLAGRAVYLWHCDRVGRYSLYSSGITNQNYLRGTQEADSSGRVSFTSIFPGCYAGRWPHIHFEVYPSLAGASIVSNKVRHVPDRATESGLRRGLRHQRLRQQRYQPVPDFAGHRQRVQRRRLAGARHDERQRGGRIHRGVDGGRVILGRISS